MLQLLRTCQQEPAAIRVRMHCSACRNCCVTAPHVGKAGASGCWSQPPAGWEAAESVPHAAWLCTRRLYRRPHKVQQAPDPTGGHALQPSQAAEISWELLRCRQPHQQPCSASGDPSGAPPRRPLPPRHNATGRQSLIDLASTEPSYLLASAEPAPRKLWGRSPRCAGCRLGLLWPGRGGRRFGTVCKALWRLQRLTLLCG